MKEKLGRNTKIIIIILGIMLTIIGVTYSFVAPLISGIETESTIAFGSGMIKITYNGSNVINGENIIPGWSDTKEFTVVGYNNTSVNDKDIMDYAIKLVVEENTFSDGAIRFELTGSSTNDNDTLSPLSDKVPKGTGATIVGTARFNQDDKIKNNVTHSYSLKISFPNDESKNQNEDMNKSFSAYVVVEEGELYIPTFSDYISNLDYVDNGLIEDDFGNLRYVGASPNNYIIFNNETWRIIGIVDGYVKIIRNEILLESFRWDSNVNNDWSTASLNEYLNGNYYNSLSDDAKSQIQEVTWHLGGWNSTSVSAENIYKYERGIGSTGTIGEDYHVYGSNSTTWTGNIALMYGSDYGYASTDESCINNLYSCSNDNNKENNWLYNLNVGMYEWLLFSNCDYTVYAYTIGSNGSVDIELDGTNRLNKVRPTLYLKSNIIITSGDGSSDRPFEIELL